MRRKRLHELIATAVLASLVASAAAFAAGDGTAQSSRYLYFKVKSPVPRGQLAHVVVQGPSGLCRITVSKGDTQMRLRPRSGVDPLAAVSTKNVGDNRVAWQWRVPNNTALGQWQVRVTCGRAATLRGTFVVTEGTGNPTGQWTTPAAVHAVLLSHSLGVRECGAASTQGGACKVGLGISPPDVVAESVTRVVSANVTGLGPSKLFRGVRRYQLFDVRACTVHDYQGTHRWSVHFRWFTRRPAGGPLTTLGRNGNVRVVRDTGDPYATDWNYPLTGPLALSHC
jgi:hypothetical protein